MFNLDDFETSTKKMIVALYARVSTGDGRQFTENQIGQMRAYVDRHANWRVVAEYIDHGTGSTGPEKRDELARLMQDAQRKKFNLVLVFSLDRFTREGVLKAFQYVERLTSAGVEFRSVTEEHFQTSGPAGELFMAVAAWMAKQERAQISKRVKAGMERARAAGRILGRPREPVNMVVLERLKGEGRSVREIAEIMKLSKSTIARAALKLKRPQIVEFPKVAGDVT